MYRLESVPCQSDKKKLGQKPCKLIDSVVAKWKYVEEMTTVKFRY